MFKQPLKIMLPLTKQNEILVQIASLQPNQVDKVLDYISVIVETRKIKNKRLKRKALVQIRRALKKGL